jgi:hypothetical protein
MSINTTRQENRLKATKAKIEKVKNELKHQRTLKTQTENAKAEADALRLAIPVLRENRSKEIKELEEVIATFPDGDPEKKKLLDDLCNLLKPLADEDTLAAMDAKGYDTTIIDLNISDLELTLEELLRTEADQTEALSRKERAYPWLLSAHLRRCACNGYKDAQGRTKNKAKEMKEAVLKAQAAEAEMLAQLQADRLKADADRVKAEQDKIDAELKKAAELLLEANKAEIDTLALAAIQPEPEKTESEKTESAAPEPGPVEAATAGLGDQP